MSKFDIRVLKDYLQTIDMVRNLQARAALSPEEAENITAVTKDQLASYISEVYKKEPEKPVKKPSKEETPEKTENRKQNK